MGGILSVQMQSENLFSRNVRRRGLKVSVFGGFLNWWPSLISVKFKLNPSTFSSTHFSILKILREEIQTNRANKADSLLSQIMQVPFPPDL